MYSPSLVCFTTGSVMTMLFASLLRSRIYGHRALPPANTTLCIAAAATPHAGATSRSRQMILLVAVLPACSNRPGWSCNTSCREEERRMLRRTGEVYATQLLVLQLTVS